MTLAQERKEERKKEFTIILNPQEARKEARQNQGAEYHKLFFFFLFIIILCLSFLYLFVLLLFLTFQIWGQRDTMVTFVVEWPSEGILFLLPCLSLPLPLSLFSSSSPHLSSSLFYLLTPLHRSNEEGIFQVVNTRVYQYIYYFYYSKQKRRITNEHFKGGTGGMRGGGK